MSGQPFTPKSHWMKTREYTPGPSLEGDIQVWEDRLYDGEKIA